MKRKYLSVTAFLMIVFILVMGISTLMVVFENRGYLLLNQDLWIRENLTVSAYEHAGLVDMKCQIPKDTQAHIAGMVLTGKYPQTEWKSFPYVETYYLQTYECSGWVSYIDIERQLK